MKKKQVNRKLSQLDAQALSAIKGGQAPSGTDEPQEGQRTYTCC
jgi:hypothetical protein